MTGLTLPPVHQVGYVVGNIEKACGFYESTYGVGPFDIVDEVNMEGAILRGKPISTKIKVAFAKSNEVELEFIEPLEGENLYTEFLEEKGDGVHHLGFVVDDMDAWKKEFSAKGFEPVFHRDMVVMEFAYFDTSMFGGLMLELLCWRK
jgi:catechol 2,3-dioxygenase-like lactoylglutathione lyase family enzyme